MKNTTFYSFLYTEKLKVKHKSTHKSSLKTSSYFLHFKPQSAKNVSGPFMLKLRTSWIRTFLILLAEWESCDWAEKVVFLVLMPRTALILVSHRISGASTLHLAAITEWRKLVPTKKTQSRFANHDNVMCILYWISLTKNFTRISFLGREISI